MTAAPTIYISDGSRRPTYPTRLHGRGSIVGRCGFHRRSTYNIAPLATDRATVAPSATRPWGGTDPGRPRSSVRRRPVPSVQPAASGTAGPPRPRHSAIEDLPPPRRSAQGRPQARGRSRSSRQSSSYNFRRRSVTLPGVGAADGAGAGGRARAIHWSLSCWIFTSNAASWASARCWSSRCRGAAAATTSPEWRTPNGRRRRTQSIRRRWAHVVPMRRNRSALHGHAAVGRRTMLI